MPEQRNTDFSDRLRRLIETIDLANVMTSPIIDSIRSLLGSSSSALGSGEASVLIRDGENGDLRFLTAIGSVADQLLEMRIPAGKGIAGFVLSSGQPMAIADAVGEEAFYAEVDRRTGFSTQTILATPLRYDGDVIGVLEYINRQGDPPFEPFTPNEMDQAAIYADSIAALVNAYSSAKLFREFSERVIRSGKDSDIDEIRSWISQIRAGEGHRERLELATMLREIAERGDAERALCRDLLEAILKFSDGTRNAGYLKF